MTWDDKAEVLIEAGWVETQAGWVKNGGEAYKDINEAYMVEFGVAPED